MEKNIILAGVGGQGILSIAFVIDNAALQAGYHFKQAEVHGMAQRGGAVQSHLRYADSEVFSDLIPTGRADMVLSVEPLEVLRYWHYLRPGGRVVSSVTPYVNIPDYPDEAQLLSELAAYPDAVLVDTGALAKAAGNTRAQNMVAVGAASPWLELDEVLLLKYVEVLFARKGEKIVKVNQDAFRLGRAAGLTFRALIDGGLEPVKALELTRRFDPRTLDPVHAGEWAEAVKDDPERLATALAADEPIPCDRPQALT
jgi:indolepyruvate ferredoxin oxidoreductase beta subunit